VAHFLCRIACATLAHRGPEEKSEFSLISGAVSNPLWAWLWKPGRGGTQDFKAGLEKLKKPWFAGKPKMSARRRLI
jgi:hypothetical protein